MSRRMTWVAGAAAAAALCLPASAGAVVGPTLPTNDLQGALALTGAQTPSPLPVQHNPEPTLAAVPPANCGAGSHPLAGEQGRVPQAAVDSPQAADGWTCNLSVVAHHDTPGGFRVWRYVDANGHACAFYDTTLLSAANVVSLGAGPSQGTVVLDVTDPAHPVETARLTDPGMLSPHESLNLNTARGLLAAEAGSAGTAPGLASIYDVHDDCRHPLLQSNFIAAAFGHESGFSPDGNTFWDGGAQGIAAIDVRDPRNPHSVWNGNAFAHGLNFTDDGNTMFDTDPINGGLTLLDVHEVQARVPNPQVSEISRLTWGTVSIPQNTNPMRIGGHPYLLEYDEFAFRFNPATLEDTAGAARIIDLADPAHPRVVSNLRLAVNMHDAHVAANGDPAFLPGSAFIYGAHYCAIPQEDDPQIAACAFLNSGLRIFDIRDPLHPREVGYFVSPPGTSNGAKADAAFSQPAFDPARREVSFTDATTGFWTVKLDDASWPQTALAACASRRAITVHVRRPRGRDRIASARVEVDGRRVAVRRRAGRFVAVVALHGRPRATVRVRITVRTRDHRTYDDSRTYRTCTRRG